MGEGDEGREWEARERGLLVGVSGSEEGDGGDRRREERRMERKGVGRKAAGGLAWDLV